MIIDPYKGISYNKINTYIIDEELPLEIDVYESDNYEEVTDQEAYDNTIYKIGKILESQFK